MGERHAPVQAEQLGKLLDKILSEGKRRNVIAHAGWRKSRTRPGTIETSSIKGIGGIGETKRQYAVSELNRMACRTKERRRMLIDLMLKIEPYDDLE